MAQARNLSLMKLFNMSDEEVFESFKAVRWSDNKGESVCPSCGNYGEHYFLKTSRLE